MSSVVDYRDQHSEPTTEPREVSSSQLYLQSTNEVSLGDIVHVGHYNRGHEWPFISCLC